MQASAGLIAGAKKRFWAEIGVKDPEAGDVVVRVQHSGISTGTEKLLWSGAMPPFPGLSYPLVPGYEAVGEVVDVTAGTGHKVGDFVFVEKGGEIIPKITGIDEERRGSLGDEIIFPEICPECNSKLEKLESEANYFCIN